MADELRKYYLTALEQETIVRFNRAEDEVEVYTTDRTVMTRLDKLVRDYPHAYRMTRQDPQTIADGKPISKTYTYPKKLQIFRQPPSPRSAAQREASVEQGRRLAEKMRRARAGVDS